VNPITLLILEHLAKAKANMIPEETLFIGIRNMTRPMASRPLFNRTVAELLKRKLIDFEKDEISGGRKLFIKEAGQVALRRA